MAAVAAVAAVAAPSTDESTGAEEDPLDHPPWFQTEEGEGVEVKAEGGEEGKGEDGQREEGQEGGEAHGTDDGGEQVGEQSAAPTAPDRLALRSGAPPLHAASSPRSQPSSPERARPGAELEI